MEGVTNWTRGEYWELPGQQQPGMGRQGHLSGKISLENENIIKVLELINQSSGMHEMKIYNA